MVASKLNENINYIEKKTIDDEDKGYLSPLYELELDFSTKQITVVIALGKPKYTFAKKGVIFYPIYVVNKTDSKIKIKSQIGVFEIGEDQVLTILDEDQDIDLSRLDEPLLYSFVNYQYIDKAKSLPNDFRQNSIKISVSNPNPESEHRLNNKSDSDSDSDSDDILNLKVSPNKLSKEKEKIESILENGIFTVNKNFLQPDTLKEENKDDANEERLHYKESSTNNWIEKFLKNNHYSIIDTAINGDCFFDTIRLAFESIGKNTTIEKLRGLVANELTDEIFRENRNLYLNFEGEIKEHQAEMKQIKKSVDELKKRIETVDAKSEKQHILDQVEILKKNYLKAKTKKNETEKLQKEYIGHIKDIDTFEKYRAYIQTSNYWAEAWTISTLENLLNIKIIILNEEAYKRNSLDNVFECGEININIQRREQFAPNFYIMTAYTGNHYRVIAYKRKRIFTFSEIPYDVKVLTINKCLEKNAGAYSYIPDFRNLQTNLGIDLSKTTDEPELEDIGENEYYDPDVVFEYNIQALDAKPGKGSKEKIPKEKITQFLYLPKVADWRRKLDDKYTGATFKVDHHKWLSVFHYLAGSKFKKGNPDFYLQFSLDSESKISESIELAKHASENGKYKDMVLRPKEVKPDIDFLLRVDYEREEALLAKFSQNEDLKSILLGTKRAKINEAIRRKPSLPDILMMRCRGIIGSNNLNN